MMHQGGLKVGLEAQIRERDQRQTCLAGRVERLCQAGQPNSTESGLRIGYHVYPDRRQLPVLGCRA